MHAVRTSSRSPAPREMTVEVISVEGILSTGLRSASGSSPSSHPGLKRLRAQAAQGQRLKARRVACDSRAIPQHLCAQGPGMLRCDLRCTCTAVGFTTIPCDTVQVVPLQYPFYRRLRVASMNPCNQLQPWLACQAPARHSGVLLDPGCAAPTKKG